MAYFYNYTVLSSGNRDFLLYLSEQHFTGNESLFKYITIESPILPASPTSERTWTKSDSYNVTIALLIYLSQYKEIAGVCKALSKAKLARSVEFVLRKIIKTLIGIIGTLLLAVILVPFYTILLTAKTIVNWIVVCKHRESVTVAIGNDALWGTTKETSKPLILTLLKLEGELDLDYIRNSFQKILNLRLPDGRLQFRKLKQVFKSHLGYHMWRDVDNFDINQHIRTVNLSDLSSTLNTGGNSSNDRKGSAYTDDAMICRYLNQSGSEVLPNHMPQWEIICFTDDDQSGFKVLIRIHHAIGDGIALVRFLLEVLCDQPRKVSLLGPQPHPITKGLSIFWSLFLIPFGLGRVLFRGRESPLHGKELTGRKVYATSKGISLDMLKGIKKRTESSMSDILFSCLSSSLATFFEKRQSEVPDITIVVPVGFEGSSGPIELQNSFAFGLIELPTSSNGHLMRSRTDGKKYKCGASLRRLHKVKKSFDSLKEDPTILSLYWITSLVSSVLPTAVCELLFSSKGKTMGFSNVPGPQKDVFLWERKVSEIKFWIPDRNPTGVGFTILSYNGEVRVSFNVDESFISTQQEADQIIEDFVRAVEELRTEVEREYPFFLDPEVSEKEGLISEEINEGVAISYIIIAVWILNHVIGFTGGAPSERLRLYNQLTSDCKPHFGCMDGTCLPQQWVCDGTEDCLEGEDESFCKDEEPSSHSGHAVKEKRDSAIISEIPQDDNDSSSTSELLTTYRVESSTADTEVSFTITPTAPTYSSSILSISPFTSTENSFSTQSTSPTFSIGKTSSTSQAITSTITDSKPISSTHPNSTNHEEEAMMLIDESKSIAEKGMPFLIEKIYPEDSEHAKTQRTNIKIDDSTTQYVPVVFPEEVSSTLTSTSLSSETISSSTQNYDNYDNLTDDDSYDYFTSTSKESLSPTTDKPQTSTLPVHTPVNTIIHSPDKFSSNFSAEDTLLEVPEPTYTTVHATSNNYNHSSSTHTPEVLTTVGMQTIVFNQPNKSEQDPLDQVTKLLDITKDLLTARDILLNEKNNLERLHSNCSSSSSTNFTGSEEPDVISKITCPNHFQFIKDMCIYTQVYPPVNWYQALTICNAQNSTLLNIPTKGKFVKLLHQLRYDKMKSYDFWVGARNENLKSLKSRWKSTNNQPITHFDLWIFNLFKDDNNLVTQVERYRQCAFMDRNYLLYINSADCLDLRGFICQSLPTE